MDKPVSLANCSLMCLVGFGVCEKAVFNTSNCLALMVVLGPLLLPPGPSPSGLLFSLSSPSPLPSPSESLSSLALIMSPGPPPELGTKSFSLLLVSNLLPAKDGESMSAGGKRLPGLGMGGPLGIMGGTGDMWWGSKLGMATSLSSSSSENRDESEKEEEKSA